jgi:hypothetical protein
MELSEFNIVVLANNNVLRFLTLLIKSVANLNIPLSNFYVGNVGISSHLVDKLNKWTLKHWDSTVQIVPLSYEDYTNFQTQSFQYTKIIQKRLELLRKVYKLSSRPILQLDADTYIIKSNFPDVTPNCDLTLTVRQQNTEGVISKFKHEAKKYPNLGVIFWQNLKECTLLWDRWEELYLTTPKHGGQFEQNVFLHLMQTRLFNYFNVDKLPCHLYNCYNPKWLHYDPYIIHFKTGEGREANKKTPNSELLKFINYKIRNYY